MNAAMVFRLMSLVPDRSPRAQSGSVQPLQAAACRYPERMALSRPIPALARAARPDDQEDQQILGVRSGGGRPLGASEEAIDELADLDDDLDDADDPSSSPTRERRLLRQPHRHSSEASHAELGHRFLHPRAGRRVLRIRRHRFQRGRHREVLLVLFVIAFVVSLFLGWRGRGAGRKRDLF